MKINNKKFYKISKRINNIYSKSKLGIHHYGLSKHIMVHFLSVCKYLNIELIIESGVGAGFSTFYILGYCNKYKINSVSIDYNRNYLDLRVIKFKNNKNSKFVTGDGFIETLKLVQKNKNKKIALLIDGPKNKEAICLITVSYLLNKNVKFVLLDDVLKFSNVYKELKNNHNLFYFEEMFKNHKLYNLEKRIYLNYIKKINQKKKILKLKEVFEKKEVYFLSKPKYNMLSFGILNPYLLYVFVKINNFEVIRILLRVFRINFLQKIKRFL